MQHATTAAVSARRSLLGGALALLGLAAASASAARQANAPRPPSRRERLAAARFAATGAFVRAQLAQQGGVIAGPVALLQRQYQLGYGEALTLAAQLEQAGVWQVYRDAAGMRCARAA